MKNLSVIIILMLGVSNINAQKIDDFLKIEIVNFYIENHEIDESLGETILNNFNESVTIVNLKDNNISKVDKVGLYKISLNISHTTSHLIICESKNKCEFYSLFSNDKSFVSKYSDFLYKNENISKKETIWYYNSLIKIILENIEIQNASKL